MYSWRLRGLPLQPPTAPIYLSFSNQEFRFLKKSEHSNSNINKDRILKTYNSIIGNNAIINNTKELIKIAKMALYPLILYGILLANMQNMLIVDNTFNPDGRYSIFNFILQNLHYV